MAGVLHDGGGRPAAGRVIVFHDQLDAANRLVAVASARTTVRGAFSLTLRATPAIERGAAKNGGFANFAIFGVTSSGTSPYRFFAAAPTRGGTWRGKHEPLTGLDIAATNGLPTRDYPTVLERSAPVARLDPAAADPAAVDALTTTGEDWLDSCLYDLVATYDKESAVGELHTAYTDLTGKFWYGKTQQADSTVTVGVRASVSDVTFGGSGTNYVGNSLTIQTAMQKTGSYGKVLSSSFRFKRWRFSPDNNFPGSLCASPPAPYEVLEATRWNGTTFSPMWDDSRFDGQCRTTWNANKQQMLPGTYWSRFSQELTGFSWTMNVAAGLTASTSSWSGASTRVGFEYWAGTARSSYYICGNNDFPAYSYRIFAGG